MPAAPPYTRVIVWFRRALRTDDHPALLQALHDAPSVVPLLCLSDDPSYAVLTQRRRFLRNTIASLDASLRTAGTMLHVRTGDPEIALPAAAREYGAEAVYAVTLSDPGSIARDARIERALNDLHVPFVRLPDRVLRGPHEVLTGSRTPFRVYTPYRNAWMAGAEEIAPPAAAPKRIAPVELAAGSCDLDRLGWETSDRGGAKEAHARLRTFIAGSAVKYATMRDLPGTDGTSKLSAYLAVGAISIRRVFHAAREASAEASVAARKGIDTFINELVWREFYYQVLVHWPHAIAGPFRPEFADIPWSHDETAFRRWQEGATGYPIVDAAMRQLRDEGWMHNRARMIVASFLTKDLHLHWQWGERYFFSMLTDADVASNNGGWQWTAGTGTDASPWFRIFNPVLQGKKFDPDGTYVRRYVPELVRIPVAAIHDPWRLDRQEQEAAGCVIGRHYPAPMVDHAEARARTLAIYRVGNRTMAPATQRARTTS
jgi:deoxyribodipyrimidine photo-lyase